MLREIETALVDRLTQTLTRQGIRVKPFPEDLRELKQPVLSAQILTAYKQSTFRTLENTPFNYEQLLQFDINCQVKGLRTHTGAYPLLDEIRYLLAGWHCGMPEQKRPAYFVVEKFVDVDDGVWSYNQTIVIPLVVEAGKRPTIERDPIQWEGLTQITIGLWRSPAEAVGKTDRSTKDAEVKVEMPLEDA